MSGLTNNTDILKGINQIIAAINALELISSCPAPEVAVTVRPSITVNCSCSGGSNGTNPPIPDDTGEASPDPPGWTQKPVDDDACKRANLAYDALYGVVDYFKTEAVITKVLMLFSALGVAASFLLGQVQGIVIWGVPLVDLLAGGEQVLGFISDLIKAITAQDVDLDEILDKLDSNKQDIVCMFYDKITNGGTAGESTSEMLQILSDDGLGSVNVAVCNAIYSGSMALMLFKSNPGIETAFATYSPEGKVDCGGCGEQENCVVYPGGQGWSLGRYSVGAWDGTKWHSVNDSFSGNVYAHYLGISIILPSELAMSSFSITLSRVVTGPIYFTFGHQGEALTQQAFNSNTFAIEWPELSSPTNYIEIAFVNNENDVGFSVADIEICIPI